MPELSFSHKKNLKNAFYTSEKILERCVSIPINCKMSNKHIIEIVNVIKATAKK